MIKGPSDIRCVKEETPKNESGISTIFTEFTRQQPKPTKNNT